jgi:hypothetical protein
LGVSLNETFIRNFSFLPFRAGKRDFYAGMVQGRFVMASWARRWFQISDRNNNGKEWVILQITQLEYLQTNVLMFRWRTFIFDVKFRLDCTTVGPIDGFQFKIVWL